MALLLLSLLMVCVQHAQAQLPANQAYFMLIGQNSGKALDLISGNTANGAVINQWSYDTHGPNQRWALVPAPGTTHFEIISWVSGKAMSVSNNSTTGGAQIWAWQYNNDPSQQWDLVDMGNGWYNIRNVRSGLVLDIQNFSMADNGMLQQYTATGGSNQKFRLQPWGDYYIRSVTSNRYVCVQNSGNSNGSPIIQYDYQTNPWFQWVFNNEGNGWYSLGSLNAPTRVLCVDNASTTAGANTQLWDYNPNNIGDQILRIAPQTDGNYKFYWSHDGMSWDIPGGQTGNNVPLQQYPNNGNLWQEFKLERDTSNSNPMFLSNSVYSISRSAMPSPTGSGVVQMKILNGTGGVYPDTQIYWCIIAQDPNNGNKWSYVDAGGTLHPLTTALNNASGHLTKNGVNYANIYTTLDQTGWVNLPRMTAARMYVSCGSPCYITSYDSGFAGPNIDNSSDPNINVYFDWTEFTIDSGGYHGNTTRVDQFGFPVQQRLVDAAGNFDQTTGEFEWQTRSGLFSSYQAQVPSQFTSLATVQAPYRIVAPAHGSFAAGQPNGNYFASTGFNTQDILLGINSASVNSTCAALNRGVYSQPQSNWTNVGLYYKTAPANYYSWFWHTVAINGLSYGFCYDDWNGQSSYLSLGGCKGLVFRVGQWNP